MNVDIKNLGNVDSGSSPNDKSSDFTTGSKKYSGGHKYTRSSKEADRSQSSMGIGVSPNYTPYTTNGRAAGVDERLQKSQIFTSNGPKVTA
jgi:hypothetical protein